MNPEKQQPGEDPYPLSRASRRQKAREIERQNPLHADLLNDLKRELLIVFLRRLGGKVSIPVTEIDATEGQGVALRVDENKVFHFELVRVK